MSRLRILPFLVALALASQAFAWVPVSEPRRIDLTRYVPYGASIASNGFDYLATWSVTTPVGARAYLMPFRADGTLMQPVATLVDEQGKNAYGPAVTGGRDGYFLSWPTDSGVTTAITDSVGRIERQKSFEGTGGITRMLSAWNGSTHLVVWGLYGPYTAVALDDNLETIAAPFEVADNHGDATPVALTADAQGFLLVATKNIDSSSGRRSDIYARRVSPTGVPGEWFLLRSVATAVNSIAVSSSSTGDLIVWADDFGTWSIGIGSQNDAGPSRQIGTDRATVYRLVSGSGGTWLTWVSQVSWTTWVAQVTQEGTLAAARQVADNGVPVDLAINAGGTVVATIPSYDTTRAKNVSTDAAPFELAKTFADEANTDVAGSPSGTMLAVWDEGTADRRHVFVNRVDETNRPLHGAGVRLSASGDTNTRPAAAWGNDSWLVAWVRRTGNTSELVTRRVAGDGTVLDSADLVLGNASFIETPRVVSDGASWLVVWTIEGTAQACANFGTSSKTMVAKVALDGRVLVAGRQVPSVTGFHQQDPDATWDGAQFLLTWRDTCPRWHQATLMAVSAATLSPDLAKSSVQLVAPVVASSDSVITNPRIATNEGATVVAYQRTAQGTAHSEFRIVKDAPASRHRAAALAPSAIPSVEGAVVALAPRAAGGFTLLTKRKVSWVTGYDAIHESTISPAGAVTADRFVHLARFEQSYGHTLVQLPGSNIRWIGTTWFDEPAAANRGFLEDVN